MFSSLTFLHPITTPHYLDIGLTRRCQTASLGVVTAIDRNMEAIKIEKKEEGDKVFVTLPNFIGTSKKK